MVLHGRWLQRTAPVQKVIVPVISRTTVNDRDPLVSVSSDSAKPAPTICGSPTSTTQTCSEAHGGTSKTNNVSSPVANCTVTRDGTKSAILPNLDDGAADTDTISMPSDASHLNTSISDSADIFTYLSPVHVHLM